MSSVYKKSVSTTGKYKSVAVENGTLVDVETGVEIDLFDEIASAIGEGVEFTITVASKDDYDID